MSSEDPGSLLPKLSYGRYVPRGRSSVAERISRLDPKLREALYVNDYLLAFMDSLVTLAAVFLEDDGQPFLDKLDATEFAISEESQEWISTALEHLDKDTLESWTKKLRPGNYSTYANRLLGGREYDALVSALQKDVIVLVSALKKLLGLLMPFAVALDDLANTLTADQLKELNYFGRPSGPPLLGLVVELDRSLGRVLEKGLPIAIPATSRPDSATAESSFELENVAAELRSLVSAQSDEVLLELSTFLARKLQGARDALQYSSDGVSQAAGSLVELIDRLSREAFDEQSVLRWVAENFTDVSHLRYTDVGSGVAKPTKKAQLLCLAYLGGEVGAPGELSFQRIVAVSLVAARSRLQRLKHADTGSEAERAGLLELVASVEGAFVFLVRVCWAVVDAERLSEIKSGIEDSLG